MEHITADVCVVGAGLAGISAALAAAEEGASVALVADGRPCGGSSFRGGTWGLGMVLPTEDGPDAAEALAEKVLDVGLGCSNDAVVRAVCAGAWDAARWLEGLGVALRAPSPGHERDRAYIPCFDDEVRGWRLFEPHQAEKPLTSAVEQAGIAAVDARAVSLLGEPGRVAGALGAGRDGLVAVHAAGTVLATGGTAGICASCLTLPSLAGSGVSLAADAGAATRGLEFIQVMTGIERPGRPLVFNEKVWRATTLTCRDGSDAFGAAGIGSAEAQAALEAHSYHGPFTVERASRPVERAIAHAEATGGCWARTDLAKLEGQELVSGFAGWLRDNGIDSEAPLRVRLYAQAANGGIVVDERGRSTVPGLCAAGECAQVYGADRLGGMASVMAVTLGRIAGREAASLGPVPRSAEPLSPLSAVRPDGGAPLKQAADRMLLGPRTATGLKELLGKAEELRNATEQSPLSPTTLATAEPRTLRRNAALRQQAVATAAVAQACLDRTGSLGPHWRSD